MRQRPMRLAGQRSGGMGRRAGVGALVLAVGASVLAGIGGGVAGAASSKGSITLYSGQHEQTTNALIRGFEKQTGITVNVRSDDEDVLGEQIVTEGSHSPADVFFTENSPVLQFLAGKGLLANVNPPTLAHVPSRFDSPNGKWVGVSARVSVIVYNTSLLKKSQLPTSAMQLAQSKWKGKVGIAGSETDFQPIVTSIIRAHGQAAALKWLESLKTNASSHSYPDNETLVAEVNKGQVAMGIINQYYWYRLRDDLGASGMHSAIAYFAPHDVGYVIDVSGAAVLKSSHNQAAAQKFMAYITSKAGQEIINHSTSWEYPIGSGVQRTDETPFSQLQPNTISIAQLGTGAQAITLLQEAQLL